jgi:transaldolase
VTVEVRPASSESGHHGHAATERLAGAPFASSAEMGSIRRLRELRQSVWLDYLDRRLLASDEMARMLSEDGLAGMTSNPTIFQKAIAGSADYDQTIRSAPPAEPAARVYERIAVHDVAAACDRFRPVHEQTHGADGFVSIEVSPELASDTEATVDEVRRLWRAVDRPNVMVKIPGTREGVPAIERCLTEGININITLLFAVERYLEVAGAFLRALEARAAMGRSIDAIASVASFFVSRIDTKVDRALDALPDGAARRVGRSLRGRAAIANAKVAYEAYRELLAGERWRTLAARGARPQRLLWASTSTKDPVYPDVYYAEALIAPQTIDTMTLETLRAFRDHGDAEVRITSGLDRAREDLSTLSTLGIDFGAVTNELEEEGVRAFVESHQRAMSTIEDKRRPMTTSAAPRVELHR